MRPSKGWLFRAYRPLTVACVGLLVTGMTVGIIVPAGPGWDFANFYDTGRRVVAGQIEDIYHPTSLIQGQPPQGTMAFWGSPLSALFYAPLGWFSPGTGLVLFKLQNTIAYCVALLLLYGHNRRFVGGAAIDQSRFLATFALVTVIYQPFWTVYRVGGQTTATVFLLLALGLVAHMSGRMLWSALCLVVAVLIKPAFSPVLVFLLLTSGVRFVWHVAVLGGSVGLVSLLALGWPVHREFLTRMLEGAAAHHPWFNNSSLYVVLDNIWPFVGGVPAARGGVLLAVTTNAIKGFVLLTAIWLVIQSRAQPWSEAARRHFHFLLAVSVCLLLSQVVWEHYLAALFLPLAYIVASRRFFSPPAMAIIGSIFALSIGQNLIVVNLLRYSVRWDSFGELLAVGVLKSGPLLLFLIFLWTFRRALFQSYMAPAWLTGASTVVGGAAGRALWPAPMERSEARRGS